MDYELLKILGVSLGLGLLTGLQREYHNEKLAGIRTFSLITLLGSVTALIGVHFDSVWLIGAGLVAIAILVVGVNVMIYKNEDAELGQTTEVAMLLMYGIGAYLVIGDMVIGVVIGAITILLLHLKGSLSSFVDGLSEKDITAIMQFTAISLLVLPILPNQNYGPYEVLNPRDIWMMVVLIVGISLVGYFIYKWLGKKAGTISNGILGGLISSTATTVTFARQTNGKNSVSSLAAFIILVASAVSMIRVLLEVLAVTPHNFAVIAPPIIIEILVMVLLAGGLYYYNSKESVEELPEPDNPAQFKSALIFGALYGIILLGVAAAKDYLGQEGLYIITIISGLTDVDAITLSLSNTLNRGEIEASFAWKLILIASLSNLLFKGILAAVLGSKKLGIYVSILFGISIIAGIVIVLTW
ncbi:MgtC/SapB family protein [Portibacter lacus]|uniref:DUF4010 domain-containing protein n=1 Tax=Portibacter lacus TaxID=1099794 RepID=A0AA37WDH0_9BACT|nr:MgtC/SapB family protein [Portibacter lacus]GLR15734.1 hypothetical protein GCM10007940_03490 [Portibacter lacus]